MNLSNEQITLFNNSLVLQVYKILKLELDEFLLNEAKEKGITKREAEISTHTILFLKTYIDLASEESCNDLQE